MIKNKKIFKSKKNRILVILSSTVLLQISVSSYAYNNFKYFNNTSTPLYTIWNTALYNNPTYLQTKIDNEQAEDNIGIKRSSLLPELKTSGNLNISENNNDSSSKKSSAMSITGGIEVFNWSYWQQFIAAKKNLTQSEFLSGAAQQQLIVDVSEKYLKLAQDQKLYINDLNNQSLHRRLYKLTNKLATAGQKTRADVVRARSTLLADTTVLTQDKNTILQDRYQIQSLSLHPIKNALMLQPSKNLIPLIKNFYRISDSEWTDITLQRNLTLQADKQALLAQRHNISASKGGFMPNVQAQASYTKSENYSPVVDGYIEPSGKSANITLNLPIFSGGETYYSVKSAKDTYEKLQQKLIYDQQNYLQTTRTEVVNMKTDLLQWQELNKTMYAEKETLRLTTLSYKAGKSTVDAVISAQTDLTSAKQQMTKLRYAYINNWLQLQQSCGTLTPQSIIYLNKHLTQVMRTSTRGI